MSESGKQSDARSEPVAEEKFSEMNAIGKVKHIGKIILFFVSFGFAFPSIFSE